MSLPSQIGDEAAAVQLYDLAIIGRGMIGSAAARHAAKILTKDQEQQPCTVVLIGPSEPSASSAQSPSTSASDTVLYGAHYDEGRITRRTDPDRIWAELASRSIARYEEIRHESSEAAGGRGFYVECGHLAVGLEKSDMMKRRRQTADSMGVQCANLDRGALQARFPYFASPEGCVGFHERRNSGYVSARGLVAAQTAAAKHLGVEVIDAVASLVEKYIDEHDGRQYFTIELGERCKRRIKSRKVLVCAGAFCNARPLLPNKLQLSPIKTQTVHFVLSHDDANRLENMPSMIVKNQQLWAYILPPIKYPDGSVRLKLGGAYLDSEGNERGGDREMHSNEEVIEWYKSTGEEDARKDMETMLRSFFPDFEPITIVSNSCATLNTPNRQLYIGEMEKGWAVATGGNGFAAKSSDEIGRLAAICILDSEAFAREQICGKLCTEIFCPRSLPSDSNNDSAATIQQTWRDKRKRDIAKGVAQKTVKALTTKREAGVLPKAVRELVERLEDAGDNICEMMVVRTPVQEYVGHLMQIISVGQYHQAIAESPYDKMFHLSLLINNRYVLQKNEVVDLSDSYRGSSNVLGKDSETLTVDIRKEPGSNSNLSFRELLDKTKQHMGAKAFSNYCSVSNNCQDFVLAVLQSNSLASPDLVAFIKQDAEVIFNQLPIHTKPVALALTNTAAVANKLAEEITIKHQEIDYMAIVENAKDKLPPEKLKDVNKFVKEAEKVKKKVSVTKKEAGAILKEEGRKKDKVTKGLRLIKSKFQESDDD